MVYLNEFTLNISDILFLFKDTATTKIYTYRHTLSLHDALPIFRMDERERLLKNLGQNNSLVLRNHGLLTAAPDIPRAFLWMYVLEKDRKSTRLNSSH